MVIPSPGFSWGWNTLTSLWFFFCIPQGICVVHNFKGSHAAPSKPKPEDPRGMPLMAFPRVESPLETLSAQVLEILLPGPPPSIFSVAAE